jgi:hypothetical protein
MLTHHLRVYIQSYHDHMVFHKPKSLKPCLALRKTTQVLPLTLDLSYSHILIYHNLSHLNPFITKTRRERESIAMLVLFLSFEIES